MTFASIIDGNYDSPNTPKGPVKVTISIQQETGKMISEAGGAPYAEIRSLVPPSYSGGIDLEVDGDNLEQNFDLNHFLSDAVNEQARKVLMNIYACPSDLGLQRNQWASPQ